MVADGFDKPNGLAFSPDEDVSTSPTTAPPRPRVRRRRRPHARRAPARRRTPGFPDGLKVDAAGASTLGGRGVRSSTPRPRSPRSLPGAVNFTFGGPDRVLYITADTRSGPALDKEPDHGHRPDPQDHRRRRRRRRARRRRARGDERGRRVVIAVVDPWGELVELRRTRARRSPARASPSTRRAPPRSSSGRAARWRSRSRTAASARSRCTAPRLTGGIPLKVDGEVVGAIGTSGETPDEDEAISIAGAAADFSPSRGPGAHLRGRPARRRGRRRRGRRRGVAPVISAVDAGGALMYLRAPRRRQVASVEVTTDKARTAAIYRRPSKDFEDQASGGRPSALHLAARCRCRAASRSSTTAT